MKETGHIAYEAAFPQADFTRGYILPWDHLPDDARAVWAAVEAAIRADEREECARVVEGEALETDDVEVRDWNIAIEHVASAIRGRKP